ncbi:MAG: transporter substrate-binding domain-containing protein [Owenweeksia sp.]|nr:transporter substrate-binding domain-containing protein [Owenweeksia sp.]
MQKLLHAFALTILSSSFLWSQETVITDSVITIGIKETAPFVELREGLAPVGLSLDFWSEMEGKAQILYEFKEFESLGSLIEALKRREIDMSINPITVTEERLEYLDFSQPFYISGTTFVRKDTSGWMGVLRNLFTWQFFSAIAVLLLVIFIFGLLIWLFERKKNKEMFGKGLHGLGDGFWWSAVTMTTVGYGDKAPITRGGRVIGFIWMFAAILLISGLTASIASSLTVQNLESNISTPEDLRKFKVGTITGSSSAGYLDIFGVNYKKLSSVKEGLQAVADGEMDVLVYDRPILKYYLRQMADDELILSRKDLKTDYYSFTYPKGSKLRSQLDPFLVKALKSERWVYRLEAENKTD